MVLGRISADHHDDIGVLALVERGGDGGGADAFEQRGHRRGVTQTRAVIDIVGAEPGAHELLEQICLFIRAFGGAEAGERTGAVAITNLYEACGRALHRLVPGRRAEMRPWIGGVDEIIGGLADAVLANHGLRQALRIGDVVKAEAALDAEPILIRGAVAAGNIEELIVPDLVRELAANTAIRTDAVHRAVWEMRGR